MKKKMASGWVVMSRDRHTKGIYVETTYDWEDLVDGRRLIYCQAVSDLDKVQEKLETLLEDDDYHSDDISDINDKISELVSSVQWIANEHPLRSFRSTQTI